MKKRLISLAVVFVLLTALLLPGAFADSFSGSGNATFNGKNIDTDFDANFASLAGNFQPGDDFTVTINLFNNVDTASDWYMSNDVVKPFEEGIAKNGSYSYSLEYISPNGATTTIFDSDAIGGESEIGLVEGTGSLNEYFFLGTIGAHQKGHVVLHVSIDGETQANNYFDTLARVQMRFAVEKKGDIPRIPKTSDKGDIFLWGGATLLCAGAAAYVAFGGKKKKESDEA